MHKPAYFSLLIKLILESQQKFQTENAVSQTTLIGNDLYHGGAAAVPKAVAEGGQVLPRQGETPPESGTDLYVQS
jgi:hypothetical protein